MNLEICKTILDHQQQVVPALFTERQVELIQKYTRQQQLTPGERTYFYSAIRKKMAALSSLWQEYYIAGAGMIPERVGQAQKILKEIKQERAFISGSFLYKKKYRDIDVYIIANRRKSYFQGNRHFMFITEKMLHNPIFLSSLKYSVANFSPPQIIPDSKRPPFEHLNLTYQISINEILNKEEERTLRELVFMYFVYIKNEILDSYSLYLKTEEIIKKRSAEKISEINSMTKDLILKLYSKKYMYQYLTAFVKQLKNDYSTESYSNFPIFIDLFSEVKNECYRASQ